LDRKDKLKRVTINTINKLITQDIVMPSDYLSSFKEELTVLSEESPAHENIDIEDLIKKEIAEDLDKSRQIIEEATDIVSSTKDIVSESQKAIVSKDLKSLEAATAKINKLMETVENLSKEMFSDELTGLLNRKWFFKEYLRDTRYAKNSGVVVFVDMNKLKYINDNLGHKVGDQALVYFATFMKKSLPLQKIIRFAGDEFLIVFEKDNMERAEAKVSYILKELQQKTLLSIVNSKKRSLKLSFSYGMIDFNEGDDMLERVETADKLMYKMKSKDRIQSQESE
jgi:diguanylate cyclase